MREINFLVVEDGIIWRECCGEKIYLVMFNVQSKLHLMDRITLKEYADKYNPVKNRRGHKMSEGYLYRLIRQDMKNESTRPIWFDYELTGEKDRIFIKLSSISTQS